MPGSKAVKERIEELTTQASDLFQDNANFHSQTAWLNAVQLVCPSETNPYHAHTESVVADRMARGSFKISQVSALLTRLIEEIEGGLLTSIENHAIALTFALSSITAPNT
jgi:hypothetical protein